MKLEHRSQTIVGSAVAFGISTGLLTLVFLLVIGFIGLYNNFNTDRFQDFGLLFGIFGLVFGLVTWILQALKSVRLRHSWRLILAAPLGFTLGGIILGLLVRWLNPTEPFDVFPILAWTIWMTHQADFARAPWADRSPQKSIADFRLLEYARQTHEALIKPAVPAQLSGAIGIGAGHMPQ